jgi:hypothetical protein
LDQPIKAAELAFHDRMDDALVSVRRAYGGDLIVKPQVGLAWSVVIAAVVVSGCQSVRSGPANPKAVAPVLVTQGSGPAGDYRVWAFHTSDGWTCVEVDSVKAEGGGCDPAGGPPAGGGVARNAQGVIVDGFTAEASAVTAIVRDASGATTTLTLIEVGPTLPGAKVAIANLGPAANPVAVDFLDAGGSKVDSAPLR